ncbi:MAG: L-threonylcarbamoyladenylate synthase [Planctomycetaceae bacterium]
MSAFRTTVFCKTVAQAAAMLREGQLVAFPTETVYGLGADARNPVSVAGIFESKQRPHFDPLIVHVSEIAQVLDIVTDFPAIARTLADAFWPGPLTLVLPKRSEIPDLVTAGLPAVGVRIPNHPLALELLNEVGQPLAAPSANPFGGISPTTARHVLEGLNGRVDGILDGGPCQVGVESTVISFVERHPLILRPGGLPIEDIEAVIGPVRRARHDSTKNNAAQPAPGMLSRHYAPTTPLRVISADAAAVAIPGQLCGLLTWGSLPDEGGFAKTERLCATGDLKTCAAEFFAALRGLDAAGMDVIIAHRFPDTGLGVALNDRLLRAAIAEDDVE